MVLLNRMDSTNIDINKKLRWLIYLGIFFFALVFVLYFGVFHGQLSPCQETWGQFGDFVGGTLNPILTFITIIALVYTIRLQYEILNTSKIELSNLENQLSESRNNIQQEQKFRESQEYKNDLIKVMDLKDKDLQELYDKKIEDSTLDNVEYIGDLFSIYFENTGLIFKDNEAIPSAFGLDRKRVIVRDRLIINIANALASLDSVLRAFDKKFPNSIISYHYKMKYHICYQLMKRKNYLLQEKLDAFEKIRFSF